MFFYTKFMLSEGWRGLKQLSMWQPKTSRRPKFFWCESETDFRAANTAAALPHCNWDSLKQRWWFARDRLNLMLTSRQRSRTKDRDLDKSVYFWNFALRSKLGSSPSSMNSAVHGVTPFWWQIRHRGIPCKKAVTKGSESLRSGSAGHQILSIPSAPGPTEPQHCQEPGVWCCWVRHDRPTCPPPADKLYKKYLQSVDTSFFNDWATGTAMSSAQLATQAQFHCHKDRLIVQSQATRWNGHGHSPSFLKAGSKLVSRIICNKPFVGRSTRSSSKSWAWKYRHVIISTQFVNKWVLRVEAEDLPRVLPCQLGPKYGSSMQFSLENCSSIPITLRASCSAQQWLWIKQRAPPAPDERHKLIIIPAQSLPK